MINILKRYPVVAISIVLFILICLYFVNPVDKYQRWRHGVEEGVKLEGMPIEKMLPEEVENVIDGLSKREELSPRNAFIDRKSGEIVPEVQGKKIHRSLTLNKVMAAEPGDRVSLKLVEIEPEITANLLRSINQPIGYYHTYLGPGNGGRVNNIKVATRALNNVLVAPGEIFSFNQTTGARTMERGYQLAPIMVGDQVVPGLGGGICQVSSTLYNAVMDADLEIIERSPHSLPVNYVPRGRDATVSDFIDFKFRNNSDQYILIKTSNEGYRVNVSIFSN